jgi:hypothetical protein
VNLEDAYMTFHEPDCSGIITSGEDGALTCAECGQTVGMVQSAVLAEIIAALAKKAEYG